MPTGLAQAHGRVPPRAQVHGLDPPARRCRARILPGAGARPGRPRAQVQGRVPPRAQVHGPDPPARRCTAGSSCVQVHGRVPPRAQARGRVPPTQGAGVRPGPPQGAGTRQGPRGHRCTAGCPPGRRRAAGSPPGRRCTARIILRAGSRPGSSRAQARSRVLAGAGVSEPPGQLPPAVRDRQARESVSGQRSQTGQQGRGAEAPCARCPVPVPWLTGRTSRVLARSAAPCPGGGLGGAGWRLPARAGGHTLSKGSLAERPPWSSGSTSSAAVTHLGAGTVLPSDPGGGAEQESGGRSPAPQASPLTPHMWNLKTPHHRAHSE